LQERPGQRRQAAPVTVTRPDADIFLFPLQRPPVLLQGFFA
jgi:hypothetical protein